MFSLIQKYIKCNRRNIKKNIRTTYINPTNEMISSIISNLKTIYNFFDRFFADKRTWKIISISLLCIFVFKDFAWAGDTTKT